LGGRNEDAKAAAARLAAEPKRRRRVIFPEPICVESILFMTARMVNCREIIGKERPVTIT
jgi:hypothetical protein